MCSWIMFFVVVLPLGSLFYYKGWGKTHLWGKREPEDIIVNSKKAKKFQDSEKRTEN